MVDVTLRTNVDQYYILASAAFFYYDFALTFPEEVKYIWCKLNVVNILILALRYITVFGFVPVIVLAFAPAIDAGDGETSRRLLVIRDILLADLPLHDSFRMGRVPGIVGIVCQALTIVFLVIRIHAIYDKKRWILYLTIPFGVLNVVLASLAIASANLVPLPNINGNNGNTISSSCFAEPARRMASPLLFKLSFGAIILFDSLIFVLALARMGGMYRKMSRSSIPSLVAILLRDGTVLFAVLAISNISNFLLFVLFINGPFAAIDPNSFDFAVSSGTNSEMTHVLSVVFVSRMIFNMREVGTEINEGTLEWRTRTEREEATMRFRVPTTEHGHHEHDIPEILILDEESAPIAEGRGNANTSV